MDIRSFGNFGCLGGNHDQLEGADAAEFLWRDDILNARVLSIGMLREDEVHGSEWMLYDERYRNRDFVLVDESHNFRNPDSQRYRVLKGYLATEERRVVFLTATPRNKSVWDIYHQLKLFHPEDRTHLPIDPPNLRVYFKLVDQGERRLPAQLAHVLLRRTRTQILRWYGYDAETGQRVDPDDFEPYRRGRLLHDSEVIPPLLGVLSRSRPSPQAWGAC
jgi:hypothetical protein